MPYLSVKLTKLIEEVEVGVECKNIRKMKLVRYMGYGMAATTGLIHFRIGDHQTSMVWGNQGDRYPLMFEGNPTETHSANYKVVGGNNRLNSSRRIRFEVTDPFWTEKQPTFTYIALLFEIKMDDDYAEQESHRLIPVSEHALNRRLSGLNPQYQHASDGKGFFY